MEILKSESINHGLIKNYLFKLELFNVYDKKKLDLIFIFKDKSVNKKHYIRLPS